MESRRLGRRDDECFFQSLVLLELIPARFLQSSHLGFVD